MTKEQITDIGRLRQIVLLSCKFAFLRFPKLASVFLFSGLALNSNALAMPKGISDAELVKQLKGFENASITTPDGIRIHYVEGGPLAVAPREHTLFSWHRCLTGMKPRNKLRPSAIFFVVAETAAVKVPIVILIVICATR